MERFVILAIVMAGLLAYVGTGIDPAIREGNTIPSSSGEAEPMMVAAADRPAPKVQSLSAKTVVLDRQPDGHFYADVKINGATIHMLVDTGATGVALSADDARRAGIATTIGMNDVVGEGASGAIQGEFVKIDRISLGPTTVTDDTGIIMRDGGLSLLGQTFLSKFDKVEIEGNQMVLRND